MEKAQRQQIDAEWKARKESNTAHNRSLLPEWLKRMSKKGIEKQIEQKIIYRRLK